MMRILLLLLICVHAVLISASLVVAQESPAEDVSEQDSVETGAQNSDDQEGEVEDDDAENQLEESSEATEAAGIDSIFVRPRQTEEITRLRDLYRDQVERYRTVDREFRIAKAQFEQIQTLQSLEQAVVSTREVLLVRDEVLITYFELMRTSLEDTEGIDLVDKRAVIAMMIEHIEVLTEHRAAVLQTVDREGIALRVAEFELMSQPFENTAYRGLALINIGDIQTVYDKARLIYADLLVFHEENPVSAIKQQERERAYRETERELERIGQLLRQIRIEYSESSGIGRDNYDRVLGSDLNAAYSGSSQILFYLRELFLELT